MKVKSGKQWCGPASRASGGRTVLTISLLLGVFALGHSGIAGANPLRPDPDFGRHGVVRASFGPTFEEGLAFTAPSLEPDGSVVAFGQRSAVRRLHGGSSLVRFTPGGEREPIRSFPEASVVVTRDATGRWVRVVEFKGFSERVERLEPDGRVDRSFGDRRGKAGWGSDPAGFQISAVLPLPSGEVLVAGSGNVARFRADGSLDPGFGAEGRASVSLEKAIGGPVGDVVALLAGDDGRTIVVTSKPERSAPTDARSYVLALDPAGHPDPGFQTAVLSDQIVAADERADGGIALLELRQAGSVSGVPWITGTDAHVAALDREGRPDPGFGGGDGIAELDFGEIDEPHTLLVLADGSIAIGGSVVDADRRCRVGFGICGKFPVVAHLAADGSPDSGFGVAGVRRLRRLPGLYPTLASDGVLGLAEEASGDLIAAGGAGPSAFLLRLTPRGALDPRFGVGGVTTERIPHRSETSAHSVAIDSRGRVLVAGLTDAGSAESDRATVFRFRHDGRLDRSFGEGAGFTQIRGESEALELVPDLRGGTFVLGREPADEMWIAHLRGDGSLDRGFGTRGFVELRLSPQGSTEAEGGATQLHRVIAGLPGGGLVIVGRPSAGGERGSLEVRRLSPKGHAIRSFGDDGVLALDGPRLRLLLATDLETGPDGDILISGALPKPRRRDLDGEARPARRLAVVKLLPGGRLDRRFGHNGIAAPPVRGATRARTVVETGDGSMLVAAEHWSYAPVYPKLRPLLLRLDEDGDLRERFQAAPARGEARYEAAAHARRMRQLIVSRGQIFVVSEGVPSLLAYSLDGSCEGFLPISPDRGDRGMAATSSGRDVTVATRRFRAPATAGITLRAFRVH